VNCYTSSHCLTSCAAHSLPVEGCAMLIRAQYEQLVYTLPARYPSICISTLVLAPPGVDLHV